MGDEPGFKTWWLAIPILWPVLIAVIVGKALFQILDWYDK